MDYEFRSKVNLRQHSKMPNVSFNVEPKNLWNWWKQSLMVTHPKYFKWIIVRYKVTHINDRRV